MKNKIFELKNQDKDNTKEILRLEIEKCRLYTDNTFDKIYYQSGLEKDTEYNFEKEIDDIEIE